MSYKYIRENKNSFAIYKNSKSYGKFKNLDDAILARDILIDNDWNLDNIDTNLIKTDDGYIIIDILDEKLCFLEKLKTKPDEDTIKKSIQKHKRNPNNSRYGLNIIKVFDTFIIKKQIAGDDYIFGYYDNLSDCEFVRNFLMENNWDVSRFKTIEFDEDSDSYKVVEVIDDKVYVLKTSKNSDIDLNKIYEEFVEKIYKHKYGLSNYPHLDELKDEISDLKSRFNVKSDVGEWNFDNLDDSSDVLNDLVFNLTPFQKVVYDAIDDEATFEDIKSSCARYKSKNFDEKIRKNIDELIDLNLILKKGEVYKKL